jgi:parvulin-like peptidyl-prolyl isomerase
VIPRKRTFLAVPTLVALALIAGACASGGGATPSAGSTAATVGDQDISVDTLAREMDRYTFLAGLNQATCGTPDEGESQDSACARFALSNLIQSAFVEGFATDNDVAVDDAEITTIIQQLDDGLGKAKVDQALQDNDLTRDDLEALAERVLLFRAVQQEIAQQQLTDEELRNLYRDQMLSFTTIQVDHILVETQAEAEDAYRQVTAPGATEQDFLDLAKEVSIDPSAQQNSGSLGSAVASTYVAEFAEAAVALEPGQVSQPVQTQYGWHVIRMVDKEITPFAEAKDQLLADNAGDAFDAWLRDQADGSVDVSPRYGRWDPATVSVAHVSSTATGSETPTPGPTA